MKIRFNFLLLGLLVQRGVACGQPIITTQPHNQTNYVGTTAIFTVVATGTAPVFYEWQKHSTTFADLDGRTNATLVLASVQPGDAADYRVVVSDVTGTNNSATTHLYVKLPETLFISRPTPGFVTLSWHGSMVLLEAITLNSGTPERAAWFRVADTSPVTLPIRTEARLFRLAALPAPETMAAAFETNLDNCRRLSEVAGCEDCVADFFLMYPAGTLPINPEVGEAFGIGMSLGSSRFPLYGPMLSALSDGIQPQP